MTVLLIGSDVTNADGGGVSYLSASLFTAIATGTVTELRIKTSATPHAKVAIYADNNGDIGTQLWVNNSGYTCSPGWNIINVSPGLAVIAGTKYWLAVNIDSFNFSYQSPGAAGQWRQKVADYATVGCPADGSGTTAYALAITIMAYGTPTGSKIGNNIMIF